MDPTRVNAQTHIVALFRMSRPQMLAAGVLVYALGVLMGAHAAGEARWSSAAVGLVVLLAANLCAHFADEYADRDTDALSQRTWFSGGSGVLPSDLVAPAFALRAALIAVACALLVGVMVATLGWLSPAAFAILLLGLLGGWCYSMPLLALERRGLGELTNAVLGAILIPLLGFATQCSAITPDAVLGLRKLAGKADRNCATGWINCAKRRLKPIATLIGTQISMAITVSTATCAMVINPSMKVLPTSEHPFQRLVAAHRPRSVSTARVMPAHRLPVFVGHHAVEGTRVVVEDEWQEVPVARPHGECGVVARMLVGRTGVQQALERHPHQHAFAIARNRLADKLIDQEDEAEPVFAVRAKTGPTEGAAQLHRGDLDAGLFADLTPHTRCNIFVAFHLAAQAVVFAEGLIIRRAFRWIISTNRRSGERM